MGLVMTPDITPEPSVQIVDAFGGGSALRRALADAGYSVPRSTIHEWKARGIPEWRRASIVEAAREAKVKLPRRLVKYLNPGAGVRRKAER